MIFIFYGFLFFIALLNGGRQMDITYFPAVPPVQLPAGFALVLFASLGLLLAILLSWLDLYRLRADNRKLRKTLAKTDQEVASLREMVVQERDLP